MSANENCLAGMACPECGSLGPYSIETTAFLLWSDSGVTDEDMRDPDFEDHAMITCTECDYDGIVDEFRRGVVAERG